MAERISEAMVEAALRSWREDWLHGPPDQNERSAMRAALEAALSAAPASAQMEGWQPIETVPENTRVLVWTRSDITPDDIAYVEDFLEGEHILTTQIGEFSSNEWHGLRLIGEPICWRPLPAAPLPTSEDSNG